MILRGVVVTRVILLMTNWILASTADGFEYL